MRGIDASPCLASRYGMGTSTLRASSNVDFYTKYDPLPGLKVDGMDTFSVKAAVAFARKHCMEGHVSPPAPM